MATYLVTGGAGFIGSHLAEELVRRGERVRVVDSLITGKRENLAHLPRRRVPRGRPRRPRGRAPGGRGRGLRPAPGGHPVGAALGQRSDHVEPREHRRDAQRAGGRARCRREAPGLRRLLVGLRRHAHAAEARGHADRPLSPYALQKLVGEQYLADVHAALRARDGHDPLLQRVRTAAGSLVALLGRDLAVHQRAASTAGGRHLRRRRADARLHLRGQRGRRRAARVPRARHRRAR